MAHSDVVGRALMMSYDVIFLRVADAVSRCIQCTYSLVFLDTTRSDALADTLAISKC